VTYVTPVVGVALGILVLQESLSWNEPVGAAVVLLGILLTQQRIRVLTRRAEAARSLSVSGAVSTAAAATATTSASAARASMESSADVGPANRAE
jgi:hypothetical protein